MHPPLTGIDHVHIYVSDRARASEWYEETYDYDAVAERLSTD